MDESLVIGANGFLGSHLVDALAAQDHRVRAFDRFSQAEPSFVTRDVEMVRGDFLSRSDLEGALRGARDVFHFLSTSTPATAEGDPTLDLRTNVAQTVELLALAADAGVKRFFFASTGGAIYGDQARSVYAENDLALPVSPYGIGKLTIERYLAYFAATRGLHAIALRISNPYGPRQRPQRRQGLIPIALQNIINGEPVVRYGDGGMVRDYIYVSDVVSMIAAMVERDPAEQIYNIGSGRGFSVNEVIDALGRVTGSDFEVVDLPAPRTFVKSVVLDTRRYQAEFGRPRLTALDDGIRQTYELLGGTR